MIDTELFEFVKLDLESMYKLFSAIVDDNSLLSLVKYGMENPISIIDLINAKDLKPKSNVLFIRGKNYDRETIYNQIEARTKVMIEWYKKELEKEDAFTSKDVSGSAINEKGINFLNIT